MSNNNNTTTTSFAAAQARLAARRAARESEARAAVLASQSASQLRARIASSQSPLLLRLGDSTLSLWDTISSREGTRPAFRVGQVDAELLDEELVGLLQGQVGDALKYFSGTPKDDWEAEILLALRAVLFKLTVWDHDATYGAALQNLRFTDARRGGEVLVPPSRWQKGIYGLVTVGGRYAWNKWEGWLLERDNTDGFDEEETSSPTVQRLSRLSRMLSNAHAAAAFGSFLVFLVNGRYRTLLDRVLRMRLAPPTSQVSREVSFEYLNRQLVWHAFTEFLLFVLPLVGINRWRRWLSRTWRKTKGIMSTGTEGEDEVEKKGEYAFLPERTCAICYQDQNSATSENEILAAAAGGAGGVVGSAQTDVTNPYETIPCGCVYCFVCLATRIEREEGEGWTCLRCGETVKECKPWNGDVLEPPKKAPRTKTVGFAEDVKGSSDSEYGEDEEESKVLVEVPEESTVDLAADSRDVPGTLDSEDSEVYEEEEDELGEDVGE